MRRANEFNTFIMLPATDIEAAQKGSWGHRIQIGASLFQTGIIKPVINRCACAGIQVEPPGTGSFTSSTSSQCENRSCA